MSILSILVFMLVQGHVVCDGELFPVSMFKVDSGEYQPIDPQEKDELEPLQGTNVVGRSVKLAPGRTVDGEIDRMKKDIVDVYNFTKHPKNPTWTFQPTFKDAIGTKNFISVAKRVEKFFSAFAAANLNPWQHLQDTVKDKVKKLYLTAARYLLVTHILWVESGSMLRACEEVRDSYTGIPRYWKIPEGGVCFPKPYGSATYKSDYDVGLIGINSAKVTRNFNTYFQKKFNMPSELVFDTNVYAFTLEFAMPKMFHSFDKYFNNFQIDISLLGVKAEYRMQELASAYFKVFKYNDGFYQEMVATATNGIEPEKDKKSFGDWVKEFKKMNGKPGGALKQTETQSLAKFRSNHNAKYVEYLEGVSYNADAVGILSRALLYAAEAYHTRGAIRHVVQAIQMHAITECQYYTPLSTFDLWVSMIENWGEANKEYLHCGGGITVANCLVKMSKYLSRMFSAMRIIRRSRLPKSLGVQLLDFGSVSDPELVIDILLRYKKCGKTLPKEIITFSKGFLEQFNCEVSPDKKGFPKACLEKIHAKVNAYNKILVENLGKISGLTMVD